MHQAVWKAVDYLFVKSGLMSPFALVIILYGGHFYFLKVLGECLVCEPVSHLFSHFESDTLSLLMLTWYDSL